ncbi:unnamed protein product, partial [Ectocarpus sp. 6 AP-2014]
LSPASHHACLQSPSSTSSWSSPLNNNLYLGRVDFPRGRTGLAPSPRPRPSCPILPSPVNRLNRRPPIMPVNRRPPSSRCAPCPCPVLPAGAALMCSVTSTLETTSFSRVSPW